jgi:prevent-host-death family protein
MKTVNLYEAKTQLSALVEAAAKGEEIIIAKNGKPMARLVKLEAPAKRKINFGAWAHLDWRLPDNFDEPDEEIERMFYGEDYDALVARHERGDLGLDQPGAPEGARKKRARGVAEPAPDERGDALRDGDQDQHRKTEASGKRKQPRRKP